MSERTYEVGGETLRVGSTVVVFNGNSQRDRKITGIGTSRIFIESIGGFKPVPYSKETRQSQQGAHISYFLTKAEVAEQQRRAALKTRLRDLGFEARLAGSGKDGLSPYSNDVLEHVADYLADQAERSNLEN